MDLHKVASLPPKIDISGIATFYPALLGRI